MPVIKTICPTTDKQVKKYYILLPDGKKCDICGRTKGKGAGRCNFTQAIVGLAGQKGDFCHHSM